MPWSDPELHHTARVRALDVMLKRGKRRKRVDDAITALLVVILIVASGLLSAWLLMLLIGAIHHSLTTVVPAYGYGASILIIVTVLVIDILAQVFRG